MELCYNFFFRCSGKPGCIVMCVHRVVCCCSFVLLVKILQSKHRRRQQRASIGSCLHYTFVLSLNKKKIGERNLGTATRGALPVATCVTTQSLMKEDRRFAWEQASSIASSCCIEQIFSQQFSFTRTKSDS